jgi:hypothetical protein
MPCYDERNSPSYIEDNTVKPLRRELSRVSAMLCGILTILEKNPQWQQSMFERIDYKEMGLTKGDILAWHHTHKEEDRARQRREREAEEYRRKEKMRKLKQLADELGVDVSKLGKL